MAVELTITGNGHYAGISSDLASYSASEEATPIDPADTSGGVGQISFNVMDDPNGKTGTLMLMDDTVNIADGSNGTTVGTITALSGSDGVVTVTADSRLGLMLATRTAAPQSANIETMFRYYLGLGGITDNIVVEGLTGQQYFIRATQPYAYPGWTGVIWDNLRAWATSIGAEIALVSNNIVLRPLRLREAITKRNTSLSWGTDKGQTAQNIEINYYTNHFEYNYPAYPIGGWNPDVEVYQVDAGGRLEVNLPVDATLVSVDQPVAYDYIGPEVMQGYSVIGADGLLIKTAQWLNNGGSVTVSVGTDQKSIDVVIVGANTTQGPFRIAAGSGASDAYSALRITATGTFYKQNVLRMPTGMAASETATEVGVTVDSPFISSLEQAYTLGIRTAASYAGSSQSLSVQTIGINRLGETGSAAYPTFNDFMTGVNGKTTAWNGQTFNAFNAAWPSPKTFDDFTTFYYQLVASDFSNQAFGNVAGARVRFRDAYYRITSATVAPEGVSYDAARDTTIADFNTAWALKPWELTTAPNFPAHSNTPFTFDEFASMLGSRTFNEFALTPLWRPVFGYQNLVGKD